MSMHRRCLNYLPKQLNLMKENYDDLREEDLCAFKLIMIHVKRLRAVQKHPQEVELHSLYLMGQVWIQWPEGYRWAYKGFGASAQTHL
ncbi:hypothetical protein C5167_036164 [Papaver somniferum]|nr:hypothetical protein C5167_036164 [Papaver somniferum]